MDYFISPEIAPFCPGGRAKRARRLKGISSEIFFLLIFSNV